MRLWKRALVPCWRCGMGVPLEATAQQQHMRDCLLGAPHLSGHPRDRATSQKGSST